jgi:hypothetical protein
MNDFVSINILSTIAGCSLIITLLTQVFKKYLPERLDTKWLALAFSIIVGVLRIIYIGQFTFDGIASGVFNIVILLASSIGIYEIGSPTTAKIKNLIGGKNNDEIKK